MKKKTEALERIVRQLDDIFYSDLTTAEKNILGIACGALGWDAKIEDNDQITIIKP